MTARRARRPVATVDKIEVRYGDYTAVQSFSASLFPGQIVSLLGSNGSGKTTTLRALAGLQPVANGEIRYGGIPIDRVRASRRARYRSCLLQSQDLAFDLALSEVVALGIVGMVRERERREQVQRALSAVDLSELHDRSWTTLSGGEKQRANLARCLVAKPRLLLLDEPLNHLDPQARVTLYKALRFAVARGTSVLLTTHDLEFAGWSDRVIALHRGACAADGSPRDVLTPETIQRVLGIAVEITKRDSVEARCIHPVLD